MSLATVGGNGFLLPHLFGACRRDIHGTGTTIDAAGEKAGFVFRVPRTGTIDRIGFTTRAVTTAQTLRGGLETTDTTNYLPTGTQYGGSAVGTQASPVADTFYEIILAAPATAVKGDIIAIVVQFDSTAGNLVIGKIDNEGGQSQTSFPYVVGFTTSWAKNSGGVGMHSVRYSDGVYEPVGQCIPTSPRIDTFFNNGSAADEMGNRFTVPAPMRTPGIFSGVNHGAAALDYVLYEGSTVLSTISIAAGLSAAGTGYETLYWDSPITLSPGTVYRLVVKPAAANINVREVVALNNAMLGMLPGGADWYKTSRVDGGSWTDTDTRRIWALSLLIDQVDDGTGLGRAYSLIGA